MYHLAAVLLLTDFLKVFIIIEKEVLYNFWLRRSRSFCWNQRKLIGLVNKDVVLCRWNEILLSGLFQSLRFLTVSLIWNQVELTKLWLWLRLCSQWSKWLQISIGLSRRGLIFMSWRLLCQNFERSLFWRYTFTAEEWTLQNRTFFFFILYLWGLCRRLHWGPNNLLFREAILDY